MLGQNVAVELSDNHWLPSYPKLLVRKIGVPWSFAREDSFLKLHTGWIPSVFGKLSKLSGVITARPLLSRRYQLKYILGSTFPAQWHLQHTGQVDGRDCTCSFWNNRLNLAVRNLWNDNIVEDISYAPGSLTFNPSSSTITSAAGKLPDLSWMTFLKLLALLVTMVPILWLLLSLQDQAFRLLNKLLMKQTLLPQLRLSSKEPKQMVSVEMEWSYRLLMMVLMLNMLIYPKTLILPQITIISIMTFAPIIAPAMLVMVLPLPGWLHPRGNNQSGSTFVGGHGVAPDATLVGLRLISGDFDDEQSARALLHLLPDSKGLAINSPMNFCRSNTHQQQQLGSC